MLDWKVVVAGIAALIFVSVFIAGGPENPLSNVVSKIADILNNLPFGKLFSPELEQHKIQMRVYPESLLLELKDSNISLNSVNFYSFTGKADIDFENSTISIQHAGSETLIKSEIRKVVIKNLKISKMLFENVRLELVSGKYNISSLNGTVEIFDFKGSVTIKDNWAEFEGNVTKVERK